MRRLADVVGGLVGAALSAPIIIVAAIVVWLYDLHSPFYISERIGFAGRPFRFVKIRTMIPDAAASQVDTTVLSDPRVLPIGRFIRALKLDELPQFFHVVAGSMSLVGPRPNVAREVALYTHAERVMLAVKPGITDYASIVFSDLASIVDGKGDANLAYNQFVRPWKSALSLHYVATRSVRVDALILAGTLTNFIARRWTLERIARQLSRTGAPSALVSVCRRTATLQAAPPPGATEIVTARNPPNAEPDELG